MRSTGWIRAAAVVATVALTGACTGHHRPDAAGPTSPPPSRAGVPGPGQPTRTAVLCNGAAGKTLLAGLLADLDAGRPVDLGTYFSPPIDFVRWWDPTTPEVITFLPGPTDNSVTLDALRAHLDGLAHGGFSVRLVRFTDIGYQGTAAVGEAGGWFNFDLRGRVGRSGTAVDGAGKGAVDCLSGRLKVLVVDGW